jgi:hypothetical protein
MQKDRLGVAAALVVALALPLTALAAGKHGGNTSPAAGCSVSTTTAGTVVHATGLPTDQVLNFMVTDGSGTTGWVLGYTPDGSWNVEVGATTPGTTYQFAGRTYGANGKYAVFASCSA